MPPYDPDLPPPVVVEPPVEEPPVVVEPPVEEPPVVVEPPVEEPPVVVEPPVEQPPVVVTPSPGTKAEKLAQIETLSCPIHNDSDKFYNYQSSQAPDRAAIFARIARCTAEAYPETPLSKQAQETMASLLGADSALREKIYDFLWYRLPYTDHFELYFGLSNLEARQIFCHGRPAANVLAGPLFTSEYARVASTEGYWDWLRDPGAQARYNEVQAIRDQLRKCLE